MGQAPALATEQATTRRIAGRDQRSFTMSKVYRFSRSSTAAARAARALAVVVALGALDAVPPAAAQGAWCAQYSGMDGGTNCGFYTLQQCRAAISGVGGTCSPSPYTAYKPQRRKVRRTTW
jgi:hypothetical protein